MSIHTFVSPIFLMILLRWCVFFIVFGFILLGGNNLFILLHFYCSRSSSGVVLNRKKIPHKIFSIFAVCVKVQRSVIFWAFAANYISSLEEESPTKMAQITPTSIDPVMLQQEHEKIKTISSDHSTSTDREFVCSICNLKCHYDYFGTTPPFGSRLV